MLQKLKGKGLFLAKYVLPFTVLLLSSGYFLARWLDKAATDQLMADKLQELKAAEEQGRQARMAIAAAYRDSVSDKGLSDDSLWTLWANAQQTEWAKEDSVYLVRHKLQIGRRVGIDDHQLDGCAPLLAGVANQRIMCSIYHNTHRVVGVYRFGPNMVGVRLLDVTTPPGMPHYRSEIAIQPQYLKVF